MQIKRSIYAITLPSISLFSAFFMFFLLFFGILSFVYAGGATSSSFPEIQIKKPVYDFGRKRRGKEITHVFTVKNIGTADLVIQRVKTSCGCTQGKVEPSTIAPNKTGRLSVVFDTKARDGKQRKSINVYSNDPAQEVFYCYLEGELYSPFTIYPPVLDFGEILHKTSVKQLCEIRSPSFPVSVESVFSDKEYVKAEYNKKDNNLVVEVLDNAPLGEMKATLILTTNDKYDPDRIIKIYGRVRGNIDILPQKIEFGEIHNENPEVVVEIFSVNKAPFHIRKVTSQDNNVKYKVQEIVKGLRYKLIVRPRKIKTNYLKDTIIITTDQQDQEEIVIPVKGKVKE